MHSDDSSTTAPTSGRGPGSSKQILEFAAGDEIVLSPDQVFIVLQGTVRCLLTGEDLQESVIINPPLTKGDLLGERHGERWQLRHQAIDNVRLLYVPMDRMRTDFIKIFQRLDQASEREAVTFLQRSVKQMSGRVSQLLAHAHATQEETEALDSSTQMLLAGRDAKIRELQERLAAAEAENERLKQAETERMIRKARGRALARLVLGAAEQAKRLKRPQQEHPLPDPPAPITKGVDAEVAIERLGTPEDIDAFEEDWIFPDLPTTAQQPTIASLDREGVHATLDLEEDAAEEESDYAATDPHAPRTGKRGTIEYRMGADGELRSSMQQE